MQKILLYSPDLVLLEETIRLLEENFQVPVYTAVDDASLRSQLESKVFTCAIFRIPQADLTTIDMLQEIRDLGQRFPLLIAADKASEVVAPWVKNEHDIHVLLTPFNERGFLGLTRKLIAVRRVPRQTFRRFHTNQIAEVENLGSGGSVLTCMYNLSQGGAYCEFDSQDGVNVGDLIKVRVNTTEKETEHVLNAKVVWTTPKGRFSGRAGFGFRFVSQREANQALLSKL